LNSKIRGGSYLKSIYNDDELVEGLQKGDVNSFDLLYDRYSGKIYSFGFKYLRSSEEAEELVQSVFLRLWENYRILKKELSFKSYLFSIAYNDICKLFRKRNYQKKFIEETMNKESLFSTGTEDGINYDSLLEQVQKIVDKLPEKQRIIFIKSRMEGKSTKEIANEIHLSPGTIDNYISEALKFIRHHIKEEYIGVLLFYLLFFL
jgi:RNA polymerase sigma-70 factor (family 1)